MLVPTPNGEYNPKIDENATSISTVTPDNPSSTHTNQTTRHGVLQRVLLGKERHDRAEDRLALGVSTLVRRDDARTHLNAVTNLEHSARDTATYAVSKN